MRIKFLMVSSSDSNAISCSSLFPYCNLFLNNRLTHQRGLFRIQCITIKDIAARALGDAMVASHGLKFMLPRMLASLLSEATDG
jgi:hypothetical protein